MDHFGYFCFVFVMLSYLFNAAVWSPAEIGLTSWLSCVMFYCVLSLSSVLSLVGCGA